MRRIALPLAALLVMAPVPATADAAKLRAGVGRADVTPPTGYYMMGWVDSRAKPQGVWTRLFARAIVLEEGGRKVAMVAMDANAIPGGLLKAVADNLASRGFSERNVLISASHTHAQATGFYNFSTYNTVFMSESTLTEQNIAGALDPQLYAFMVRQVTAAIRRADDDLAPAAVGWGERPLLGLTANRSLEAHLADFGIIVPRGQGSVAMDPNGYPGTIDPAVDVMRVDQVRHGRHVPVGTWSTFANHGTTVHAQFEYYGADHHASADRVVEAAIRKAGHVPRGQDVVNAYGNTDEGDQSAGLYDWGPAWADHVGRVEASAMLGAWRDAGRSMSRSPALDERWNRICFCGQQLPGGGQVDSQAATGLPLFTGSEEGRGPLHDATGLVFEGMRSPVSDGPQGDKIVVTRAGGGSVPTAVPLMALRIGDRMIVSVPGEMTVGMGVRVRSAVMDAVKGSPIVRVVIAGLANEYIQYFTTPEEYDQQHYEGGSTLYGRDSSNVLKLGLAELAGDLVSGRPAPAPYPFDPTNGVKADAAPYPAGADRGQLTGQPQRTSSLQRATVSWTGGPRGFDRPLGSAFVSAQRLTGGRWRTVETDLGNAMAWRVDEAGGYTAEWEVPLDALPGRYRFVITANRYRLESDRFEVVHGRLLTVARVPGDGPLRVTLDYPQAVTDVDLTYRPPRATGGRITYTAAGARHTVAMTRGTTFTLSAPAGSTVTIPAGAATDRYGNTNPDPVIIQAP